MDPEDIAVALARLEERQIAMHKDIKDSHCDTRLKSLELSRAKYRGVTGLFGAAMLWIGWENFIN